MSGSGLVNMLSGVALICGPRRDHFPGGSYRDQQGHHRLLIGTITVAPPGDRYRPAPPVPLVRRTAGFGASWSFPKAGLNGCSPPPEPTSAQVQAVRLYP